MKLATWLLAMLQPMLARVLTALGFSVVSVVGMQAVVGQLKTAIVDGMTGMPADLVNFALFAGVGTGIGIIFGAITTRLILWQAQQATQILGKNPG